MESRVVSCFVFVPFWNKNIFLIIFKMGGRQSSQCKFGTFGTGSGIPVTYRGLKMNLGGSDICQTTLAECANECVAMGCGGSGDQWGDCCKLCQQSCCYVDGPARNPGSKICKQLAYNARVPLPDDYCTNPVSRQNYDQECPDGCLDQVERSPSAMIQKQTQDRTCHNKLLIFLFLIILILFLHMYL